MLGFPNRNHTKFNEDNVGKKENIAPQFVFLLKCQDIQAKRSF
jgi:hypothetical protein